MKSIFKSIVVAILTFEAKVLLRRHQPKIVAITGSVGKTSTKDAIYAAIKNHTYARKSAKSFNSVDIGVQLTVLGLNNGWNNPFVWAKNLIEGFFIAFFSRKYPEILVLETGIDRPDDMEKLTRWITPDIVVLTRLPDVPPHVENFPSADSVIAEKMKLIQAMKPSGVLVYNNDDTAVKLRLSAVLQKQIGFGRYLETDFTAREDMIVYNDDLPSAMKFTLNHGGKNYNIQIKNTIGAQHVYSCLAAVAVASQLGVSVENAVESLKSLRTPNGRMRILPGIKTTTIIDDTYNSSPSACELALQALNELKYTDRKIVVMGDMLELGKYSSEEHKKIGSLVANTADVLFTVGVRARQIAEGALVSGMSEKNIFQYDDIARAGRELQAYLQLGDVVLVKASQGIRIEKVVEEVMNEPEKASELLVRQDNFWR